MNIAPAIKFSLEECMEYIAGDEYLEVTPKSPAHPQGAPGRERAQEAREEAAAGLRSLQAVGSLQSAVGSPRVFSRLRGYGGPTAVGGGAKRLFPSSRLVPSPSSFP